jgi:hypothetical protein
MQSKVVMKSKLASVGMFSPRASWKVTFDSPDSARFAAASFNASCESSYPWKSDLGNALAIVISAMPAPQPTSATLAPVSSLATTPSRAGRIAGTSMWRNHGANMRATA